MPEPSMAVVVLTPPADPVPRFAGGHGLAGTIVTARRDRNMSVEALARAADLPLALVAAAEGGEPVPDDVMDALCRALSITPARHPPPVPVSARHAKLMRGCAGVREEQGGIALVSDAYAWKASPEAVAAKVDVMPVLPSRRPLAAMLGRHAAGFAAAVAAAVAVESTHVVILEIPVGMGAVYLGVHAFWSAIPMLRQLRVEDRRARSRAAGDHDAQVREDERRRRKVEDAMSCKGHVLSPDRVTSVSTQDGDPGPRVRSTASGDVYSVRVEQVSPMHVSVTLGTTDGEYEIPWVPHSEELVELLSGYVRADGMPWTPELVLPAGRAPFTRA